MSSTQIDDYLAGVPEPQRSTLQVLRARIHAALPGAQEGFAYGVPAFTRDGYRWAGFASAKGHCSYFPMSGAVIDMLPDLLEGYSTSRGTLRFPVDAPLPAYLVRALIRARGADIEARGK